MSGQFAARPVPRAQVNPDAAGRTIQLLAVPGSLGIRRHAEELATALRNMGQPARVAARLDGPEPVHFDFGNASRSLLPSMARRRGDLVTVHDVVPRAGWVRYLLAPAQARVLARHHVVVHSQYSAQLLRRYVPRLQPLVIPLAHQVKKGQGSQDNGLRQNKSDRRVVIMAGVLKQAKGVGELVVAASGHPDLQVVLVGWVSDKATERTLSSLPENVSHIRADDDESFLGMLASADFVLAMKRESVGEASGPVVQAHLLGTPVAGLRVGSLPEYCGPGDVLLDPSSSADDLLAAVSEAPLVRIPPDDGRCFTIEDAARRYAELYRELGW